MRHLIKFIDIAITWHNTNVSNQVMHAILSVQYNENMKGFYVQGVLYMKCHMAHARPLIPHPTARASGGTWHRLCTSCHINVSPPCHKVLEYSRAVTRVSVARLFYSRDETILGLWQEYLRPHVPLFLGGQVVRVTRVTFRASAESEPQTSKP